MVDSSGNLTPIICTSPAEDEDETSIDITVSAGGGGGPSEAAFDIPDSAFGGSGGAAAMAGPIGGCGGGFEGISDDTSLFENKSGLAEDMRFLASMPEICDVTFLVGDTREPVCAVKAVLAARSK